MSCVEVVRARLRRHDDERGATTAFVVFIVVGLMAVAGLVLDGGYVIAARTESIRVAEQAARAGADAFSDASLRSGDPAVGAAAAESAAADYLAAVGHTGQVSVGATTVTVTVTDTQPLAILSAFGLGPVSVSGSGSADSLGGVTEPVDGT